MKKNTNFEINKMGWNWEEKETYEKEEKRRECNETGMARK